MPLYRGSRRLILRRKTAINATAFDPVHTGPTIALSNNNLTASGGGTAGTVMAVASHSTGKYYAEFHMDAGTTPTNITIGLQNANGFAAAPIFLGGFGFDSVGWAGSGSVFINSSPVVTISTFAAGNTLCMAVDFGNSKIYFRVNGGLWNNSGTDDPATNTGGISISTLNAGAYFPSVSCAASDGDVWTADFGATTYAQSVPSGFVNW